MSNKAPECVKVVVRCRPLNSKEVEDGRARIVDMDIKAGQVTVKNPKAEATQPPMQFTFDQVYDWNTRQRDLYDITARPIVDSVLDGYNGTIFAYGQTGTGKSFTMEGKEDVPDLRGITPNSFNHVFDEIGTRGTREYLVRASYLEIYNEDIRDLLAKNQNSKLELKETVDRGVYVKDLTSFTVSCVSELESVMQVGRKNRSVGSTLMNQDSSRSHSIFTITVECVDKDTAAPAAESDGGTGGHIRVGKLNLVDLAGSERQSKTGATGDRLKEGIKINLSLTALGNVISALVDGKSSHIPYRDSKLTRLLQDSLGGNTKTVMVANIGPADWNFDETISTLRYANRAKNIKNKPKINEDPKDAMLREFQDKINELKAALEAKQSGAVPRAPVKVVTKVVEVENQDKIHEIQEHMRAEIESKMKEAMTEEALQRAREEAEARAKAQLTALMVDQKKTDAEKKKIQKLLDSQHAEMAKFMEQVEAEQREMLELQDRLKQMESKVIHGGVNLVDKDAELEKAKEATERELLIQQRQEEERLRRQKELEAQAEAKKKEFSSIEEELRYRKTQAKDLKLRLKTLEAEIDMIHADQHRNKAGILEDVKGLEQAVKLKELIIRWFVPPEYIPALESKMFARDNEGESWGCEAEELAGNRIREEERRKAEQEAGAAAMDEAGADGDYLDGGEGEGKVFFSYKDLKEGEEGGGVRSSKDGSSRPRSNRRPMSARKEVDKQGSRPASSMPKDGNAAGSSSSRPSSNKSKSSSPVPGHDSRGVSPARSAAEEIPKPRGLVKTK